MPVLSTILICASAAVGILALLEILLSEPQKLQMSGFIMRLWLALDRAKHAYFQMSLESKTVRAWFFIIGTIAAISFVLFTFHQSPTTTEGAFLIFLAFFGLSIFGGVLLVAYALRKKRAASLLLGSTLLLFVFAGPLVLMTMLFRPEMLDLMQTDLSYALLALAFIICYIVTIAILPFLDRGNRPDFVSILFWLRSMG